MHLKTIIFYNTYVYIRYNLRIQEKPISFRYDRIFDHVDLQVTHFLHKIFELVITTSIPNVQCT